jgi:DNA helicase HerA-like ATPase
MPATLPTTTVEVTFTASPFDSFTLDDPVRGVLDNSNFTLGGEVFEDITADVLSVAVTRGKSRTLDHFTEGVQRRRRITQGQGKYLGQH